MDEPADHLHSEHLLCTANAGPPPERVPDLNEANILCMPRPCMEVEGARNLSRRWQAAGLPTLTP